MKITEEVLKNGKWISDEIFIYYGKNGNCHDRYDIVICNMCGKECMRRIRGGNCFCDIKCSNKFRGINGGLNYLFEAARKSNIGRKASEETKKKMSDARIGKKHTMATKEKMSNSIKRKVDFSKKRQNIIDKIFEKEEKIDQFKNVRSEKYKGEGNPFYGKKHSDETKKKIKETFEKNGYPMSGKKHSEETKLKMSKRSKGRRHTEESKKKLSDSHKGKIFSEEHLAKLCLSHSGERNSQWKGGVRKSNIPLFGTYAPQLEKYEEIRESEEGYLEVRCTYCGKWYMPKTTDIWYRLKAINGLSNGENRLYCSNGCKKECPIYGKTPEQLMREDAIRAGLIDPTDDYNREVQPELRKLVLARDNYTCKICGSTDSLHCHHKKGIWQDQLESADVDNCDTLCKYCHIDEHKKPGMTYYELRRKICDK
jgi:hypothetical protein